MTPTETPAPDATSTEESAPETTRLEEEGEIAADYLEELLDIADLDGDIDIDVEHDRAAGALGADDPAALSSLVGDDGRGRARARARARLAVQARTGERSRLMLDVAGFRAGRRRELTAQAAEAIERVRAEGTKVSLEPLNAFERKVIHDAVAAAGLRSDSEGVEPQRYVVIYPAD